MTNRKGNPVGTYSGRMFYPLDPRPEDVYLTDIAHSLSLQCRYAGHCKWHYSVAEHSILVARLVRYLGGSPAEQLMAYLHDSAEAYVMDLPRPLKQMKEFVFYNEIEKKIFETIIEKYRMPFTLLPKIVEKADDMMLATEAPQIMSGTENWTFNAEPWVVDGRRLPLLGLLPGEACSEFMAGFYLLWRQWRPKEPLPDYS